MRKAALQALVAMSRIPRAVELRLDVLLDCYLCHQLRSLCRAYSWSDEYTHLSMLAFFYRPVHGCQWLVGYGGVFLMLANTNKTYIFDCGKFTSWLELKEHYVNDHHGSITVVEHHGKTGVLIDCFVKW
jgi:hypothetical protein